MTLEIFTFDQRFVTGIEGVDSQHQRLVDTVNGLGEHLVRGKELDKSAERTLFQGLVDYARFHFADEERMMRKVCIDGRHIDSHVRHHREFVEQITAMWRARGSMRNAIEVVHGFLTAWLTFHILGEDQAMARQIELVANGVSPEAAFLRETGSGDARTATLLQALQKLYNVLTMQNRDLADANLILEAKVADRVRELSDANTQLARDREELEQLLRKVDEAQQQVLQSEKMAAIGQLAAGVAHEINNPVGFVTSNLRTLTNYAKKVLKVVDSYEQCAAGNPQMRERFAGIRQEADYDFVRDDIQPLLEESREGLARVTKIVQDLKGFSHVGESGWQKADLHAGMESTLNVVWNELKYKAEIVRDYGCLPPVPCIPAQINQVFMNVLVNAAQAIEERGRITIRSGVENEMAWIEVEDTGKGMTPTIQKQVFEPFFTTKPVGKGTGLGLSISYDIVKRKHRGNLDVDSTPGKGTRFRIWLPLNAAETPH